MLLVDALYLLIVEVILWFPSIISNFDCLNNLLVKFLHYILQKLSPIYYNCLFKKYFLCLYSEFESDLTMQILFLLIAMFYPLPKLDYYPTLWLVGKKLQFQNLNHSCFCFLEKTAYLKIFEYENWRSKPFFYLQNTSPWKKIGNYIEVSLKNIAACCVIVFSTLNL